MKNVLLRLSLLCIILAAFSACDEQKAGVGNFSIEVKNVGPDYVELAVTAPSPVEMAYTVVTEEHIFTPAMIFGKGKTITVHPGEVVRIPDWFQSNSSYYLYAAAKLDEMNYSKISTVQFTTKPFNFNKLLTLVDTQYDGYRVHITVPQSVKDAGNVVRYSSADMATYNVLLDRYDNESLYTLLAVIANGNRHGNYAKNDTTLLRDNSNIIVFDENGDPALDDEGNQIDIHNPITPGEPTIFLAGECRWGTDQEMGAITGFRYGVTDCSYQVPIFDWSTVERTFDWKNTERDSWEGSGWTGAFQKLVFRTSEPMLCNETVNINIPEKNITVTNAEISFEMGEGVSRYIYMIVDNATYNGIVDVYLDKKDATQEEIDKDFQWFLSSYYAFADWGVEAKTESLKVDAAASTVQGVLMGGTLYHVLCTVLVDDPTIAGNPTNGAKQRFIHKTFRALDKTMLPPVVEIKALEGGDPFEAVFNIKAPNKDLVAAYCAANYAKEFKLMLNMGASYETILESGNEKFTTDQINAINSDEGLTIYVPSLDGEVMRFAVYGRNKEYTFNEIGLDEKGNPVGWADCEVPMAPKSAPIGSELYSRLAGDWTATALAKINEKDEEGNKVSRNDELVSKVTISRNIPNMPDKLDESVYALYPKDTPQEVDDMFEVLGTLSDTFDEYRIQGQNRLLCTGFLDYDIYENGRMTYRSPYDLFVTPDYKSVDVPQLIYDFGPKWFLQVQPDGSVVVPFSTKYLPPMHSWPGYPFYLGGYNVDDGVAFLDGEEAEYDKLPGFPVEISPEFDKITIKPIVRDEKNYYVNAIGVTNKGYEINFSLISEIVLTKGWNGSSTNHGVKASPVSASMPTMVDCVTAAPEPKVYKSITKLDATPAKELKYDENPNIVTLDMINRTADRIVERYNLQ